MYPPVATLQSHKGSSGTSTVSSVHYNVHVLQSHKGSSGTLLSCTPLHANKASIPQGFVWNHLTWTSSMSRCSLQSHKGSSGTVENYISGCTTKSFNPTRVRLEQSRTCTSTGLTGTASIPQGFVWNSNRSLSPCLTNLLQSHKGSSGTIPSVGLPSTDFRFNPTRVRLEHDSRLVG